MEFQEWINSSDAEKFVDDQNPFEMSKAAWKASRIEALEWVKREAISLDERGDISRNVINRELEKLNGN
jgi:hypothetical protein